MKFATQIAEEWTVGPIVGSHLTSGGQESLIQPFFESKLGFQHITPFLSDIEDVREAFFHEFVAIVETEVQGGRDIVTSAAFEQDFKNAFERRRAAVKKAGDKEKKDSSPEDEARGLFQRFIERRRNVRGDRIGKPLAKFVEMGALEMEDIRGEPSLWRMDEKSKCPDGCFFFSRPGARELFKDMYHPPTVEGRMVVSVTQIATMDSSAMMIGAARGAKSRGHERQVLALATEIAEAIAAVGGHPCLCCWTADVGGIADDDGAERERDQEREETQKESEIEEEDGQEEVREEDDEENDEGDEDEDEDEDEEDEKREADRQDRGAQEPGLRKRASEEESDDSEE